MCLQNLLLPLEMRFMSGDSAPCNVFSGLATCKVHTLVYVHIEGSSYSVIVMEFCIQSYFFMSAFGLTDALISWFTNENISLQTEPQYDKNKHKLWVLWGLMVH